MASDLLKVHLGQCLPGNASQLRGRANLRIAQIDEAFRLALVILVLPSLFPLGG